ncbi:uncharacterized protein LOC108198801 [Daucus carota subsp. sativus]|uniref:uncharacterized protein LOC108198801 n=1 Tax=Daucus carota subsp. sativus TaxID=79200 RepID=UPI0007EFBE9A|nr:PREDICTED: uncharacterized protein LOC108198801 [Daucus carota subsp. sativus]
MAAKSKRRKLDDSAHFTRTASASAGKQETYAPPPRRPKTDVVQNRGLNPESRGEMAAESKRRKVDDPAPFSRTASSSAGKQETFAPPPRRPMTNAVQNRGLDPKIQQARDYAVAQAQQDGCMANFKIIDSPFGNFLLPVIPTRAELNR